MTNPNLYSVGYDVGFEDGFKEAQGRVKGLEAKLSKAMKALEKIAQHDTQALALNTLAELKGDT